MSGLLMSSVGGKPMGSLMN